MNCLSKEFFLQEDALKVAQNLLGTYLFTDMDGQITGGIITETEAYKGTNDRASHAFGGRKTKRNAVMYHEGGVAYVYLCYGMHHLLNFVTNQENIPDAVLIRAIYPTHGCELMLKRTGKTQASSCITDGPGKVTKALGITMEHNGIPLDNNRIWIEDRKLIIAQEMITASPRIGVDYAGEDALLPYRFNLLCDELE